MKNILFTLLSFSVISCATADVKLEKKDFEYCNQFLKDAEVAMRLNWSAETSLKEALTLINDTQDEEYKQRMTNLLFWANAWPITGEAPEMVEEFSIRAFGACLDWERIKKAQDMSDVLQQP